MRKIFLIVFMVLSVLIISCLPPTSESGEKTALAGLAISKGCYDADNDGYGARGHLISSCKGSRKLYDCDDTSGRARPGGMEVCDGFDNDCDGTRDEDPVCPRTCTDVDGGINSTVRGYFSGINDAEYGGISNGTDWCVNMTTVAEYFCGANPRHRFNTSIHRIDTYCESGCLDGACISSSQSGSGGGGGGNSCTPTTEICDGIDNDCDGIIDYLGGETVCQMNCYDTNPEGSGYVTVTAYMFNGSIIPSQTYTRSDFCADDDFLMYFYCEPRSNYPGMEITGRVIRCSSTNPLFVCVDPDGRLPSAAGNYSSNLPAYCGLSVNSTLVCGNGILESGELCDDGNTINGDSCSQCTCVDSDVSSSNPYTVRGNVTRMDASGAVVINYDYCDPEGTDLFEYACDGNRVYASDYSCTALNSEYRCIDRSNDVGYPRGYSAYCGR